MTKQIRPLLSAFQNGLIFADYQASMKTLKRQMVEQYQATILTDQAKTDFAKSIAKYEQLLVLVMTEDYCPDSVLNLPVVVRLVEANPTMSLRVVRRSDYASLAEQYPAADGYNHIPTVFFITPEGIELGVWHERSAAAHAFLVDYENDNPQPSKTSETGETTLTYKKWAKKRLSALQKAYQEALWLETVKEFMALLD